MYKLIRKYPDYERDRIIPLHTRLTKALQKNIDAQSALINSLLQVNVKLPGTLLFKTPEIVDNNIKKAINFLLKKGTFAGRSK